MENELQHHGVQGMKWGIRRYQNKDGTLTKAGKKRYAKELAKVRAEEKRIKNTAATKAKIDKLEARKQALKEKKGEIDEKTRDGATKSKEAYEEAKAKAIKSGSATEVLKYKGDLTKAEMQSITDRIRWEQEMKTVSAKEMAPGESAADKFFKNTDKAVGYVQTGAKAWNMFANIYNAFSSNDIALPKIEIDVDKGNRNQRKEEKRKKKEAEENKKKEAEENKNKNKNGNKNKNENDNDNDSNDSNDSSGNNQPGTTNQRGTEKKGSKWGKRDTSNDDSSEPVTGEVIGTGTSRRKNKDERPRSGKKSTKIYDAEYVDITDSPNTSSGRNQVDLMQISLESRSASNLPTSYVTAGETRVAGLLESGSK